MDFGLVTLPGKEYKARTLKNVIDGDGTVIYGDLTGGTRLTAEFCERENKPYIVKPTRGYLAAFTPSKSSAMTKDGCGWSPTPLGDRR